jgi:hypothetical protein
MRLNEERLRNEQEYKIKIDKMLNDINILMLNFENTAYYDSTVLTNEA